MPEQTDLIPPRRGIEAEAFQLSPRAMAPIGLLYSCEQPQAQPEDAADLNEDCCLLTLLFAETRYRLRRSSSRVFSRFLHSALLDPVVAANAVNTVIASREDNTGRVSPSGRRGGFPTPHIIDKKTSPALRSTMSRHGDFGLGAWAPSAPGAFKVLYEYKVRYLRASSHTRFGLRLQFRLSSKVEILGPRTTSMIEYLCTQCVSPPSDVHTVKPANPNMFIRVVYERLRDELRASVKRPVSAGDLKGTASVKNSCVQRTLLHFRWNSSRIVDKGY
jgi:hypothetical protein